jgi:hypothetical protein
VCSNPEKVALRASHLTEDVVVASQVPKRKECDLDALAPVNSVNFYNLDVRQALAMPELPTTSKNQVIQAGPAPRPAPPKILPIVQVNPYAAAVAASIPARRPFGLSSNTNWAVQPVEPKQPASYIIVEDPPVKSGKKIKTVEASPYTASPSLAGRLHRFGSIRPADTYRSKWNLQKAFDSETLQDPVRHRPESTADIAPHEDSLDTKLYVSHI